MKIEFNSVIVVCVTLVMCSAFYAMSTPSTPKTESQISEEFAVIKIDQFRRCVNESDESRHNMWTVEENINVMHACADVIVKLTSNPK